ncbi:MAG: TlpA family protein disulfide reductase [Saprospiraceae bacterium]
MKKILLISFVLISLGLIAFTPPTELGKKVKLSIELKECSPTDSIFLYQFEGFGFEKIHTANKKGNVYEFKISQATAKFYYLGKNTTQLRPIILGTESDVKVKGTCTDLTKAIIGSKLNQEYEGLKEKITALKQEMGQKMQDLQKAKSDEGAQKMAIFEMSEIDDKKIALLNEYKQKNALLGEVAALNTYLSFQNTTESYYTEIDYFANQFFQFADFKNPYYNDNPWVYEAFKEYATTLSTAGIDPLLHQSYLDDLLSKVAPNPHAYQLALSGVVTALDDKRHKNYMLYAKRLLKKYDSVYPELIAPLKKKINTATGFGQGEVAPDFVQKTPAGADLKLSDLRGKIVLVDFWASWCGPCRRENPHVKKLYEKYNHRGFEVLGVSLDRTKASWERAIEQDGLEWEHVSDLKGWKNEVAKMYSVSSIPHTILLDQEGRIIARKLRSPQLEQLLVEIFGS